jgi:hypothetical protein
MKNEMFLFDLQTEECLEKGTFWGKIGLVIHCLGSE